MEHRVHNRRTVCLGLAGLAAALAGCSGGGLGAAIAPAPLETFDLTAPRGFAPVRGRSLRLEVVEPQALRLLDGDRFVVRAANNDLSLLAGAQWADRLPRLIQTRLIQTFENASRPGTVAKPGDGLDAQARLAMELRAFEIDQTAGSQARVEITARLIAVPSGRALGADIFRAAQPATTDPAQAAGALDRALGEVMVSIVRWVAAGRG